MTPLGVKSIPAWLSKRVKLFYPTPRTYGVIRWRRGTLSLAKAMIISLWDISASTGNGAVNRSSHVAAAGGPRIYGGTVILVAVQMFQQGASPHLQGKPQPNL